jgi:predicted dehydrogenase
MALSELAFDAGLAVFCEKPLTVDFEAARRCIQRIEAEGQRAAVNFALASTPGLALLQQSFGNGSALPLASLTGVDLDIAFAAWPRPWQAAAGAWLSERIEGGFTREVLSHFVFVLQRVLGPLRVKAGAVDYPAGGIAAETGLRAELDAAGVPIHIEAKVAGEIADQNRMVWRAAGGEIALSGWFSQITQQPVEATLPAPIDQLDQWVALIEGRAHSLPGYAESLAVQETIEAMLKQ